MKQNGGSKINSRITATIPVEVMPSHSQHPTCMEIVVSHRHLLLVCCHRKLNQGNRAMIWIQRIPLHLQLPICAGPLMETGNTAVLSQLLRCLRWVVVG